jgi:hypothetical protein
LSRRRIDAGRGIGRVQSYLPGRGHTRRPDRCERSQGGPKKEECPTLDLCAPKAIQKGAISSSSAIPPRVAPSALLLSLPRSSAAIPTSSRFTSPTKFLLIHQSEGRPGAWPRPAVDTDRPCRRGDRISLQRIGPRLFLWFVQKMRQALTFLATIKNDLHGMRTLAVISILALLTISGAAYTDQTLTSDQRTAQRAN